MNGNFVREVSETQSKYKIVKKNITQQSSYNLSVELENYLYDVGAIKRVNISGRENDGNIYYTINDDVTIKFGEGLLNIIGIDYASINPKIILVHTTNNNKFQIRRNDHNVDSKELNWYRVLYDNNFEGANFEVSYDENRKILLIDNKILPTKIISKIDSSTEKTEDDYINTFKNYYLNHLHDYIELDEQSIALRNQFSKEVPLESIASMNIDDYVMGDGKTSGLSYDLEHGKWKFAGPGIGGQNVSKFGISVHDGKYVTDKHMNVIENPEEFWNDFRNQLYSFLKEYETLEEPIHAIDKYPLLKNMGMVITKLLYLYYPDKFINITTKNKLSVLMRYFGYDFDRQMGGDELSFILNKNLRKDIPELNDNDPVYIGEALWHFISDMIESDEEAPEEETGSTPEDYDDYTKDYFLNEVFMSANEYDKLCGLLDHKKNIILQGSPGVGKTFMAKRLAYSIIGKKAKHQILSVQFHQSYSYEDFIEGIRPNSNGEFVLKDGVFKEFVKKAKSDRNNNYYVIIDEINRGNLSKILGELMKLIESDKRDVEDAVLPYSNEQFIVPSNLYIIGTMNTADRSLAMVDYALRRRFAFYHVSPAFGTREFTNWLINKNEIKESNVSEISSKMIKLNEMISNDLGKGFEIGHSYFVDSLDKNNIENSYNNIVQYEIIPLLEEYWFDDDKKVEEYKEML